MAKRKRLKQDSDQHKVIHVAFGPGGGRIDRAEEEPVTEGPAPAPSGREPVSDRYTQAEVARLLGISQSRLRSLDRANIVSPSGQLKGRRAYTFNDIIALRAARELLDHKVRLGKVAEAIERIRQLLPRVARPLNELRIASDGKEVVVKTREGAFEPLTGQMVMDFDVQQLHEDVVRLLRPRSRPDRVQAAYELYLKASQLDESPDTWDEAERLYREAIQRDPYLAIVYTNLGNILFRRGDEAEAERLYRSALDLEQAQPEAQYNLGYIMLSRGQARRAIEFFKGAIASDPRFADAYFNLAMAYEQADNPGDARECWQKYIDIEPTGTWAEVARQHLGE